jgi:hypothetical protein
LRCEAVDWSAIVEDQQINDTSVANRQKSFFHQKCYRRLRGISVGADAMKTFLLGAGLGAVAILGVWGILSVTSAERTPAVELASTTPSEKDPSKIELICELSLNVEGQLALGIKDDVPSRITLALVDFEKNSGWYQGKLAISESRPGTLKVVGNKLHVVRPAMFERFGVMINREEFIVDRKTGDFQQTVGTKDGRIIPLINGTCAQVIKAPF